MIPEYKKELLDFSLNKSKTLRFYEKIFIRFNAKLISKLWGVVIFNNQEKMLKYVINHHDNNGIKHPTKRQIYHTLIYVMLLHLFGNGKYITPENMFKYMKGVSSFREYINKSLKEDISEISTILSEGNLEDIIPEKTFDRDRFELLAKNITEVHQRIIFSIDLVLVPSPSSYRSHSKYIREKFNSNFIPYEYPAMLLKYMLEIVKAISYSDINGEIDENKLPYYLKDQLLGYQTLIKEFVFIRNKYLKSK